MGRPGKLTPATHKAIVDAVRAGNYAETAARAAGIHPGSFYNWMEKGREAKQGIYFEFLNAIEKAKASAEIRDVSLIERAATDTWTAAAWMLERKFPSRWGRREKLEVAGDGGGPVKIVIEYEAEQTGGE
jgi:transposase